MPDKINPEEDPSFSNDSFFEIIGELEILVFKAYESISEMEKKCQKIRRNIHKVALVNCEGKFREWADEAEGFFRGIAQLVENIEMLGIDFPDSIREKIDHVSQLIDQIKIHVQYLVEFSIEVRQLKGENVILMGDYRLIKGR